MRFSTIAPRPRAPAPLLGEHNEEVLGRPAGLSPEEIERLRTEKVIGGQPDQPVPAEFVSAIARRPMDAVIEAGAIKEVGPDYRERLGLQATRRRRIVTGLNRRLRIVAATLLVAALATLPRTAALAQPAQPCPSAERGAVLPGQTVTGRIDECHPEEFWTFEGIRGQAIVISMERPDPPTFAGLELDPILRLLGPPVGERTPTVAEDDDSGTGVDARIELVLRTTGTYRIVATSFERAAGDYVLRLKVLGMAAAERGPIQPGETVGGRLDASNEEEVWTFEGTQGQRVLISLRRARPISLESIALDPLLFLMAPEQDGTTPVEDLDDDGGDAVDALIVRVLERTGTYRILATRLADSFGEYQLTLQVEERASSE